MSSTTEMDNLNGNKSAINDGDQESSSCSSSSSSWQYLPDPVFLQLTAYLSVQDVLQMSVTCRNWWEMSQDDYLWKRLFRRDFKVSPSIGLRPGAKSWKCEYERLISRIPMVKTDELHEHAHQVLHVSFSHNGKLFATCSKDGYVIVWNSAHPVTKRHSYNMKQFNWKYTQFSQFNSTDTLLLVSGVHFGTIHSSSGEIAVFNLENEDFLLQCRVSNRPYDIFGTWLTDQFLISGDIHWLAHLVSTSVIWLNRANQETRSEHVQILKNLYKFYNHNGSSIRAVMVANCPWLSEEELRMTEDGEGPSSSSSTNSPRRVNSPHCSGNPVSRLNGFQLGQLKDSETGANNNVGENREDNSGNCPIQYSDKFRRDYERGIEEGGGEQVPGNDKENSPSSSIKSTVNQSSSSTSASTSSLSSSDGSEFDDLELFTPKYLIFSLGSRTYTPHQIGFKKIRSVNFPKHMDMGLSLQERIARRKQEAQEEPRFQQDWLDYDSVADQFDKVDKLIDLHGHVIGMGLSPDHRYLYVNSRPWPENYVITNPMEPPPIAQEIDIHVIDMMTLEPVGNMLRAHKAYTPNTECFFIFLDVCDQYVGSGAEDRHAYLWDRYYGVSLAKYHHSEVVNSVAFNPRDNEMFVTTSDDYTIKVWRSTARAKSLGIPAGDIKVAERALELKLKATK